MPDLTPDLLIDVMRRKGWTMEPADDTAKSMLAVNVALHDLVRRLSQDLHDAREALRRLLSHSPTWGVATTIDIGDVVWWGPHEKLHLGTSPIAGTVVSRRGELVDIRINDFTVVGVSVRDLTRHADVEAARACLPEYQEPDDA